MGWAWLLAPLLANACSPAGILNALAPRQGVMIARDLDYGAAPRLKLDISKPVEQHLLIDKGKGLFYQPKINQAQEFSLGGHANAVDQFMAIGFGQSSVDLKKNYQVSFAGEEIVDGKKTAMLDLTPKTALAGIKTVRLWMDEQKGLSLQVKVVEAGGDYALYKYSNIKLNGAIPDSVFDLKLPKNVHVNKLN